MSRSRRRSSWLVWTALSGTAFQLGYSTNNGCVEFPVYFGIQSLNFCGIVNCDGGTFFDFCRPVALLLDCPNLVADGG
ncbi:hypothetical protein RAS1_16320 [Phycisphaerae bacterium RAS1]|nr:hypothetical protein RAS1_16320 [Phycisphaerae bacterium RAS1]